MNPQELIRASKLREEGSIKKEGTERGYFQNSMFCQSIR
jgi:hypothetical protein